VLDLADPKLGTTVGDRYRLEERLGAGGMGVVYRGVEISQDRPVAVKFLHDSFAAIPDLVKRFQREVTAMSRLRHPNLVAIVDSGVAAGVPYLVMDFHAGRALADVLERGALSPARALRITRQVLAGVGAAHERGVVHRDLKPDNILLVGSGEHECVKILDFGLAKMVQGSETGTTQLTNTGLALGTPAYMSPEQARGTPTDHRADLYAVAVMLYQMLVGRKPFVSDSAMAVMRMHMDDPPLPPRKAAPDARISAALERVVLRGMEKDPAARFQGVAEFERALDATPEGGASDDISLDRTLMAKGAAGAPPRRRFRLGRRGWRILGRLAAVLLVAGAGTYGWRRYAHRGQVEVRHAMDKAVGTAKEMRQAVDKAVGSAKDALRSVTPPVTPDEDDADDRDPTPPRDTPGMKLEAASQPAHPAAHKPRLGDAIKLIIGGKVDEGVQVLYQLRRKSPHDPEIALWLGHAYFRKLWRTDGLREYDDALEERPSLRRDAQLIRDAVGALDDPTYRLARALLRKRVGTAALPELRRAAREGKNARVESRAARLATELAHGRARR
jgi:serine/threonine-protein kinase